MIDYYEPIMVLLYDSLIHREDFLSCGNELSKAQVIFAIRFYPLYCPDLITTIIDDFSPPFFNNFCKTLADYFDQNFTMTYLDPNIFLSALYEQKDHQKLFFRISTSFSKIEQKDDLSYESFCSIFKWMPASILLSPLCQQCISSLLVKSPSQIINACTQFCKRKDELLSDSNITLSKEELFNKLHFIQYLHQIISSSYDISTTQEILKQLSQFLSLIKKIPNSYYFLPYGIYICKAQTTNTDFFYQAILLFMSIMKQKIDLSEDEINAIIDAISTSILTSGKLFQNSGVFPSDTFIKDALKTLNFAWNLLPSLKNNEEIKTQQIMKIIKPYLDSLKSSLYFLSNSSAIMPLLFFFNIYNPLINSFHQMLDDLSKPPVCDTQITRFFSFFNQFFEFYQNNYQNLSFHGNLHNKVNFSELINCTLKYINKSSTHINTITNSIQLLFNLMSICPETLLQSLLFYESIPKILQISISISSFKNEMKKFGKFTRCLTDLSYAFNHLPFSISSNKVFQKKYIEFSNQHIRFLISLISEQSFKQPNYLENLITYMKYCNFQEQYDTANFIYQSLISYKSQNSEKSIQLFNTIFNGLSSSLGPFIGNLLTIIPYSFFVEHNLLRSLINSFYSFMKFDRQYQRGYSESFDQQYIIISSFLLSHFSDISFRCKSQIDQSEFIFCNSFYLTKKPNLDIDRKMISVLSKSICMTNENDFHTAFRLIVDYVFSSHLLNDKSDNCILDIIPSLYESNFDQSDFQYYIEKTHDEFKFIDFSPRSLFQLLIYWKILAIDSSNQFLERISISFHSLPNIFSLITMKDEFKGYCDILIKLLHYDKSQKIIIIGSDYVKTPLDNIHFLNIFQKFTIIHLTSFPLFQHLIQYFYRGISRIFFLLNTSSVISYNEIEKWIDSLSSSNFDVPTQISMIGIVNEKSRVITFEQGKKLVEIFNGHYYEFDGNSSTFLSDFSSLL